jgi:tetratricopeptide (TPR) repeat protein
MEGFFVATLRRLSLPVSRSLLCAAAVAACAVALRAEDSPGGSRSLMRLPRWIESLADPGGAARRQHAATPQPASRAATNKPRPAQPEAARPADRGVVAGRDKMPERDQAPSPVPVVAEDQDPSAAPAAAVLRGPARTPAGKAVVPAAEWTDLVPTAGAPAKPAATTGGEAATGADTGGLKKWLTDRVATKPKAAAPAEPPAAIDAAPAKPVAEVAKPTVTAPVAATPDELPTLSVDPASFRGVLPGRTTREELQAGWGAGEPFTREDGSRGLFWKIEPFDRVEVTLDGDVVAAIRIKLAEPAAVAELAKQLEIADLRTVSILDEQGVSIGEVFPERGVIFSVKPGTQSATAVMIEALDPESFVLRAEGEMEQCSAYAVADLECAIEIDPKHLRAHRLLMVLMSEQGRWQRALELAEAAERIDPTDVWTRLKHAGILLALDRPDEARSAVESVKSVANQPPLVSAQVERLLGRIDMADPAPDYQKAVEHFAEAIRRSSALLTKRAETVQQAAREILLDAHVGTAEAIARGTWQQKSRVIPKWMSRAEAVVTECKAEPEVLQTLELKLCRGALAVAAGSVESVEPLPWVKRLLEVRDRMGEGVTDPWRRRQIDWEAGRGLLDALAAAQLRGDSSDMLDNATLTAAYLERGGEQRELTDAERQDVGTLLFRIGIMHSLLRGDHATAVTWFDRVIPLWDGNPRLQQARTAGEAGESYVSMAISYWQVERRDDAMALSRRGVDLMVAAVDAKQLEERSLAVAYGNLSTMYAEQGDDAKSQTYAELATRAESSGTIIK